MIRQYQHSDYNVVVGMFREFYSSSAVLHSINSSNFDNTLLAVESSSPYVQLLVIEQCQQVVGYVLLSLTYSNEAGGIVVLIEELYVTASYRNKGLGRLVLDYIIRHYPQARRFRLEACKDNSGAIALYQRMGFVPLLYNQYVLDI